MTPAEWDRHEREWCDSCAHQKRGRAICPALAVMRQHPDDVQVKKLFKRLGRCSQYQYSPKVEKANAKKKR